MTNLMGGSPRGRLQVNVTEVIDSSSFNAFSMKVALICFLAIVFDGLDSALFGTILPAIMADMKMGPAEAGLLGSVGHIGAVIGAAVFGIAADAIGRKKMMIIGMTIFIIFSAACGLTQGVVDFAIYRLIAGFGLAGIVPIAVALVFEYTPLKWKSTISSVSYTGISVGVLLSALVSILLLSSVGWRTIMLGTIIGIVLVPVAIRHLPESMTTLVNMNKNESIREVLKKVDTQFVTNEDQEYILKEAPTAKVPLKTLFQDGYAGNTLFLGIGMLSIMMITVTLTTWIAQLMVQRGYSLTMGITFILVFTGSNFISTPLAGWLSGRIGYKKVFSIYMPILFISISLIGVIQNLTGALICMFFAGFSAMGATCILLPYVGSLYPMNFRSSAMGVIYAIGRVGPIIGPALAGFMLAAEISVPAVLVSIAAPSVVAMIAFLQVKEPPLHSVNRNG
ncbi:MFS transporter [Aestuariicella hydrocarbonica]|uniref:MFS transporter n=1 Tax=Pseudomaricurvus hydrocarbonicus TaxID=1470433 RepID=A0A9E5MQ25_9GAMM|nr:MFS transporter [Aestuariicella hydrocarbonica]NHO68330.1 MFS transporter [Aestuariicella hydrocarbonica]